MSDPFDALTAGEVVGILAFDAGTPPDLLENIAHAVLNVVRHRGVYIDPPPKLLRLTASLERKLSAAPAAVRAKAPRRGAAR